MSTLPTLGGRPLRWSVTTLPPHGEPLRLTLPADVTFTPGDFFLAHGTSFMDRAIQFWTRSQWNHAGAIITSDGDVLESMANGLVSNNLRRYVDEVRIVHLELPDDRRADGVAFIQDLASRHDQYGWWSYPALILRSLTNSRLVLELDGTDFCSEVVCRMLEHAGVILPTRPALATPANLFEWFVESKTTGSTGIPTGEH